VRVEGEGGEDDIASLVCSVKVTLSGNLDGSSVGGAGSVNIGLGGHVGAVDRKDVEE
jgi:hypothetical protein